MNSKKYALVPELRFPEFKNDGEWEETTLDEVATIIKGKSISKSDIVINGSLPCIRYGELYTYYNETIVEVKSYTNLSADDLVLSKANDVIIPASGETQIDIATASCVLSDGIALGADLNIIRSEANGVFLSYYLNNAKKKDIAQLAQGISVVHLYPNQLKKLVLVLPKLDEQQKIASCLSSLDKVIAAQTRKQEALKEHKKGLLQNLFPQEGQTVPKYRFPEFLRDKGWKEKKLEQLTTKVGSGVTPLGGEATYKRFGRPFVRSQNVGWGNLLLANIARIDERTHQDSINTEIELDDVLLNITGASIGRSAVATNEVIGGNVNQHVCIIRTIKDSLNPNFLCQYLISSLGQRQIDSYQAGGNRQGLNFAQIRSLSLPIPPSLNEQAKIAESLSSLDTMIRAEIESIEQLKSHKRGLMQGLFPSLNMSGNE